MGKRRPGLGTNGYPNPLFLCRRYGRHTSAVLIDRFSPNLIQGEKPSSQQILNILNPLLKMSHKGKSDIDTFLSSAKTLAHDTDEAGRKKVLDALRDVRYSVEAPAQRRGMLTWR